MSDRPGDALPPSVARIRRLEQLELERLEAVRQREERHQAHVAGAHEGEHHERVEAVERLTRYPLAALGVAWIVVLVIVATGHLATAQREVLVALLFAIWVVALAEYLVRLILAPDTRAYVRHRWVEPVTVIVPVALPWHLVGMEKVTLIVHEGALRLRAILRHHSLFRVLLGALGVVLLGAWLVMLFERDATGSNIHDYPDALWWAVVTVTTVGYGDRFPVTEGGRAVAVVLMLVGIGLIGTLTATVASIFVKEHTDASTAEVKKGHADLTLQIALISDTLADIERRLGATDADEQRLVAEAEQQAADEGDGTSSPG